MTDSLDRKARGGATPEEIAKLKTLKEIKNHERTELSDLPGWAKAALVYKYLYDVSYEDALKAVGVKRAVRTLENYRKTPAGKDLRAMVQKFSDDPVAMANAFLRSSAMGVMVDRIAFLEMAKATGNFIEADKIARDLQDRVPELAKKSGSKGGSGTMTIQVNLPGGASLEPIMIDSSYELTAEELPDYEIEDRDG